jgi:hypothetical protein
VERIVRVDHVIRCPRCDAEDLAECFAAIVFPIVFGEQTMLVCRSFTCPVCDYPQDTGMDDADDLFVVVDDTSEFDCY